MANTWRVFIEELRGVGSASRVQSAREAFRALAADFRPPALGVGGEDAEVPQVVLEVASGDAVQRTRAYDLDGAGDARIDRSLFVAAPDGDDDLIVRAMRPGRPGSRGILIGEARVPGTFGERLELELERRGRSRGTVVLTVTRGLASPEQSQERLRAAWPQEGAVTSYVGTVSHPDLGQDVRISVRLDSPSLGSWTLLRQTERIRVQKTARGISFQEIAGDTSLHGKVDAATGLVTGAVVQQGVRGGSFTLRPTTAAAQAGGTTPSERSPLGEGRARAASTESYQQPSYTPTPSGSNDAASSTPLFRDGASPPLKDRTTPAPAAADVGAVGSRSGHRPLRRRPPGQPPAGNVDVTLEQITGLSPPLRRPYLIVGLEGQEFLADDLQSSQPARFTFEVSRLQSNLQIYCYSDGATGGTGPVGRILVPLSEVVWPAGSPVGAADFQRGMDSKATFQRRLCACLLPVSEHGDGYGLAGFSDRFGPDAAAGGTLGSITLTVEVTLAPEVRSLVGLCASSITAGARAVAKAGGDTDFREVARKAEEGSSPPSFREELTSLRGSMLRLRHYCSRPSRGLACWLQGESRRCYAAAASWFLFCVFGFFPCSLWLCPVYLWLALLGNGLLAAQQRSRDWSAAQGNSFELFWQSADPMEAGQQRRRRPAGGAAEKKGVASTKELLLELDDMLRSVVGFLERIRNMFSFADPAASVACFLGSGVLALGFAASFAIMKWLDPGLNYVCGCYGALAIVKLGRAGSQDMAATRQSSAGAGQTRLLKFPWAFNQVLSAVPDEPELAHRFVAGHVQMSNPAGP